MPQEYEWFRDFDRNRDQRDRRDDASYYRQPPPFDFFRFLAPRPPVPSRRRQGPPSGPPPSYIPRQPQAGVRAVDPGAVEYCLFRFMYIWPRRQRPFWFYPVFAGPRSIAGYRWNGFTWVYYGTDLDNIESFQCV